MYMCVMCMLIHLTVIRGIFTLVSVVFLRFLNNLLLYIDYVSKEYPFNIESYSSTD